MNVTWMLVNVGSAWGCVKSFLIARADITYLYIYLFYILNKVKISKNRKMLTAYLMAGRLKSSLFQLKTEKSVRRRRVLDLRNCWSCFWNFHTSTLWSLICREPLSVRQLWMLYIQRGTLRPGDRYNAQTSFQSTWNHTVLIFKFFFLVYKFSEEWFPHNQQILGNFHGSRKMMGQVFEPRGSCWILLWDYLLFD